MNNTINLEENKAIIEFDAIPDELKGMDNWVLWKCEQKVGKLTKIPYDANSLGKASTEDSSTWTSFEIAKECYLEHPEFDGMGVVFTAEDYFTGIDLDDCLNENGGLEGWAIPILDLFMPTYCEISPSGRGLKLWVRGSKSGKWQKADGKYHCRRGKVEVYSDGRYFTVTGRIYDAAAMEITENQEGLDGLFDLVWGTQEKHESQRVVFSKKVDESDDEILKRVLESDEKFSRLWSGDFSDYSSQSEADLALCSRIAFWWKVPTTGDRSAIDRIFRRSGLYRPKWDRGDYRQMTINKALEGAVSRDANHNGDLDSGFTVSQNLQKTDEHFAEMFINLHGKDVLWCEIWGRWLVWDGRRWKVDDKLLVNNLARGVNKHFLQRASKESDPKTQNLLMDYAKSAAAATRMNAFLSLVKPQVPVEPDELDVNPMLLNTPTGTVDLTTGVVKADDREDKITKMTKATFGDINAACPQWNTFLNEVLGDNAELVDFMQRAIGYALTGEIRENVLFIMHGDGANGKTTLVETVMHVLGDYAKSAAPDLLLQRRNESHPTGVADLMGARFVSSVEVDDGRKLNEALVKRLTGRDTVKARFMRRDFFEFKPSHKLFMAVNHRPEIQGTDKGIWRRIRLIPFEVEIPEEQQDPKLLEKLIEEAPGILSWSVRGCLKWQHSGLGMPAAVKR